MSCPQIQKIEKEKDREKEKMGDRPAKVDEKKSDRKLEREKKKRRIFLLEEKHENFVAVARKWKMLAATKGKIRGRGKKVNKNTYDIFLHKTCN